MPKLIIQHAKDGVYCYEESDAHYRVVEKNRPGKRRKLESVDDNCRIEVGEYIVVDLEYE